MQDYITPGYNQETNSIQLGTTIYTYPAAMVRMLTEQLPNGQELINRAHIRGNYPDLSRTFESFFGRGTFRVFMSLPISEESMVGLKELFSSEDDAGRRNIIEKLLSNRPYDKEKLRRIGVL